MYLKAVACQGPAFCSWRGVIAHSSPAREQNSPAIKVLLPLLFGRRDFTFYGACLLAAKSSDSYRGSCMQYFVRRQAMLVRCWLAWAGKQCLPFSRAMKPRSILLHLRSLLTVGAMMRLMSLCNMAVSASDQCSAPQSAAVVKLLQHRQASSPRGQNLRSLGIYWDGSRLLPLQQKH